MVNISIRGRILEGKVVSFDNSRARVKIQRRVQFKKYRDTSIRSRDFSVRINPNVSISIGDSVLIGETRPTAKKINFMIVKVL